jgi:hypothetical protein
LPTVLRFRGLLLVIYPNDHWPPHVHVIGAGREDKIALGLAGQRPSLVSNEGLSRRGLTTALVEVDRNRDLLIRRWREIHGDA